MAKEEKKALFKEQKETLKSAQAAFSKFGKFELQGRKHFQKAIIHCYELYLEYEEEFIKEQCKKQDIKFKAQKPAKMVLMLAMQVSDDCDEHTKARIRAYVRVLNNFKNLQYSVEKAQQELAQYGIDYFANDRDVLKNIGRGKLKKCLSEMISSYSEDVQDKVKSLINTFKDNPQIAKAILGINDDEDDFDFDEGEDEDSNNSKKDELDDLRDSDDDNTNSDDDEDSEDDDDDDEDGDNDAKSSAKPLSVPSKGAKSASPKGNDKPLSERFVNYFKQNGIKDENFVIWVKDGKVQKSNDSKLLLKLKAYNFTDL